MKKTLSLLLTLCLMISVFSAFAIAEQATQTVTVPAPVTNLKDDSAFQGEWKVTHMVMGDQLIDMSQALTLLGSEFPMNFKIADGKVISPSADGTKTEENAYVFENSFLKTEDAQGVAEIYLLEDGRLGIEMTAAAMEGMKIGLICEPVKAAE